MHEDNSQAIMDDHCPICCQQLHATHVSVFTINKGAIVKISKCGHHFHQTCLFNYVNYKQSCPVCHVRIRMDMVVIVVNEEAAFAHESLSSQQSYSHGNNLVGSYDNTRQKQCQCESISPSSSSHSKGGLPNPSYGQPHTPRSLSHPSNSRPVQDSRNRFARLNHSQNELNTQCLISGQFKGHDIDLILSPEALSHQGQYSNSATNMIDTIKLNNPDLCHTNHTNDKHYVHSQTLSTSSSQNQAVLKGARGRPKSKTNKLCTFDKLQDSPSSLENFLISNMNDDSWDRSRDIRQWIQSQNKYCEYRTQGSIDYKFV